MVKGSRAKLLGAVGIFSDGVRGAVELLLEQCRVEGAEGHYGLGGFMDFGAPSGQVK